MFSRANKPVRVFKDYLFIAFALLLISGCSVSPGKELKRVSSPDNKFDAVLAISPGEGAMVSDKYDLYIVPKNRKLIENSGLVLTGDQFDQLPNLVWRSPHNLDITYKTGYIDHFTDYICWDDIGCNRLRLIYSGSE